MKAILTVIRLDHIRWFLHCAFDQKNTARSGLESQWSHGSVLGGILKCPSDRQTFKFDHHNSTLWRLSF